MDPIGITLLPEIVQLQVISAPLSTTKKFGSLLLLSSPIPPSKNPVQVSWREERIVVIYSAVALASITFTSSAITAISLPPFPVPPFLSIFSVFMPSQHFLLARARERSHDSPHPRHVRGWNVQYFNGCGSL